jgi:aminoglycoside 6'-N-acetyltransferase
MRILYPENEENIPGGRHRRLQTSGVGHSGGMAVALRPLERGDLPLLALWLGRPHVEKWWREPADLETVEARYGPMINGSDSTDGFIVMSGGRPIGFMQRYLLEDNPEWQRVVTVAIGAVAAAGIDYLIGVETETGRGLGPQMIAALVADCWASRPDIEAVVVDVLQENRASWRALERAGFHRVWEGTLDSDDPSDDGPCFLYVTPRPG